MLQSHIPSCPSHSSNRELPSPSKLPALAQTYVFWRWPHHYLEQRQKKEGNRFTMKPVGLPSSVFLSDASDIMAMFRAPADTLYPGAGAAAIKPLVGARSFITADGTEHAVGRRAIMPAYHREMVDAHAETIGFVVESETAMWPSDRPFAVYPYLRALTLRVILASIFGEDGIRVRKLRNRLLTMFDVTDTLLLQEPPLRYVPRWHGIWRRFLLESEVVDKLILDLIHSNHAPEDSVLGFLFEAHNPDNTDFTIWQVRDTIMSLVLAGYETTAAQLAWAFQMIAHHPTVLGELLSANDSDDDAYLTATIQETMRHRPVFLCAIPRVVQRDFEIAGTTFRPPAHLLGCLHLLHHDPQLHSNPQSFIPERFLDDPPTPHTWLPWGGGRKRCPGRHLAMFEMEAVLRAVLARWEILPAGREIESARWRSVIVTPSRGSGIILRPRSSAAAARRSRVNVSRASCGT
jgi:cytochrome P450